MVVKTDPFRDQHMKIMNIVDNVSRFIEDPSMVEQNALEIVKLLSDLSRSLKVHLTLEDTSLYPVVSLAENSDLKIIAGKYKEEMGGIKDVFESYIKKWSSSYRISEGVEDFVNETGALFKALRERIEREDNILYSMIDEMFKD